MKYTYLLFDADETLFDFAKCEKAAFYASFDESAADMNLKNDEKKELCGKLYRGYTKINEQLWKALERGEVTRGKLTVLRFEKTFELSETAENAFSPEEFNRKYIKNLGMQSFLIPGATELLEKIRNFSDEIRMFIITNGIAESQHRRFDRSPVKNYMSDIFISEEIGCKKPEKEYFEKVMNILEEKFGYDRARDLPKTLVIGDSLSADIAGGINAGIDTVWFNPKFKNPVPGITFNAHSYGEIYDFITG